MKMVKIIIISTGTIITILTLVFACYGGFKKVQFKVVKTGGETLAYQKLTGDYSQSRVAMDKVYYSLLNEHGIETFKGFGIYYDNPKLVDKDKLRSEVGCIIEEKDRLRISELQGICHVKTLPQASYIITEFPYKGNLSVFIGILKIYPALNKYLNKHNIPKEGAMMEIYDTPNKKIIFRKIIKS